MSASDDASLVEYARYFGLARQFRPDYAANLLAELAVTAPLLHTELAHDCDGLFDRLDKEYQLLIGKSDQPPTKLSQRAFDILEGCQVSNEIDVDTIYRNFTSYHKSISKLKLDEPLLVIGGGEPRRDARRIRDGIDLQLLLQMRLARVKADYTGAKNGFLDELVTDFDLALSITSSEITATTTPLTTTSLEILRRAVTEWDDHTSVAVAIESTLPKRPSRREKNDGAPLDEKDLSEWLWPDDDADVPTKQVQVEAMGTATPTWEDTTIPTWEDIIDEFDWSKDVSLPADIHTESYVDEKLLLSGAALPDAAPQALVCADDNENLAKLAKATVATASDSMDIDSDDQGRVCDVKSSIGTDVSSSDPTMINLTSSTATACTSEAHLLKLEVPKLEAYSLRCKGRDVKSMLLRTAEDAAVKSLNHQVAPLSELLAVTTPATEPAEDETVADQSAVQKFLGRPKAPIRSEQLLWKQQGLRLLDSEDDNDDELLAMGNSDIVDSVETEPDQSGYCKDAKLSQEGGCEGQISAIADGAIERSLPWTTTHQFSAPQKPVVDSRPTKSGPWKLRLSRSAAPSIMS